MRARPWQTWIARRLGVRRRLARLCTGSLLCVMVVTTTHAREEAARFSKRHQSPCAKMVQAQSPVAVSPLESLAKQQAPHVAQARHTVPERPWHRAMRVESTLHHRASLHPENAQTFQHGQGGVVGHPGTQSVVILNDLLMPLRPIPCSRPR